MTEEIHEKVSDQVNELFGQYKRALIKNVIGVGLSVVAILVTILIFIFSSVDTKLDKIITIAVNDGKQDVKIELMNNTLFRHDTELNELKINFMKLEAIIREEKTFKYYTNGH